MAFRVHAVMLQLLYILYVIDISHTNWQLVKTKVRSRACQIQSRGTHVRQSDYRELYLRSVVGYYDHLSLIGFGCLQFFS